MDYQQTLKNIELALNLVSPITHGYFISFSFNNNSCTFLIVDRPTLLEINRQKTIDNQPLASFSCLENDELFFYYDDEHLYYQYHFFSKDTLWSFNSGFRKADLKADLLALVRQLKNTR